MRRARFVLLGVVAALAMALAVGSDFLDNGSAMGGRVAYAAEAHGDGHGGHDDHGDGHGDVLGGPNATMWKTINFLVLLGIAAYMLRGKVGPFFDARNKEIAREITAAAEREAEAQERLKAVEAKISGLESEIAQLRDHSRDEMERDRERVAAETASAIARIQENSSREIESAGIIARAHLSKHAASLALDLAEQQVRAQTAQPGMQDRLLNQALERASRAADASRN